MRRLVRDLPDEDGVLHWDEALRLSSQVGDSGRLLLVGFARHLPLPLDAAARRALVRAVRQVHDPVKQALAYLALAESTPLTAHELRAAGVIALGIPDTTLRIMVLSQLAWRAG